MKLRDIIARYREQHDMSRREFGRKCGLSNAYISILETGVNPRTGEPLSPTVETYQKIAKAMGISLNDLLNMLSADELITLNAPFEAEDIDPEKQKLLDFIEQLPDEQIATYRALFDLPIERLRAIVDLFR